MKCGDLVRAVEIGDDITDVVIPLQVFDNPPDWRAKKVFQQIGEVTHHHPLLVLRLTKVQYGKQTKKVLWAKVLTPFCVGWVNTLELEPI